MITPNTNITGHLTLLMEDGRPISTLIDPSNQDGKNHFNPIDQGSFSLVFASSKKGPNKENRVVKITMVKAGANLSKTYAENELKVVESMRKFIEKPKRSSMGWSINVVMPYEYGKLYTATDKPFAGCYFIYETLAGRLNWLKFNKVLSEEHCVNVISQIASGLTYLVTFMPYFVHRDISINNIMYNENNNGHLNFKLIDFGTSIIDKERSEQNSAITTPDINAPEITNREMNKYITGNKEDVYCLGMCLFILLSQKSKTYGNYLVLLS
jgi:serine/threonine protein kinase